MRLKRYVLLIALAISPLPLFAYSNIDVINNTDSYGTGYINFSPCSASAGDKGILKPHATFSVPESAIKLFCGSSCDAHVFASKSCSGKEIAKVKIDSKKGVTSITNYDKEHYNISGGGTSVTIDPVAQGLSDWFHSLF